MKTCLVVDDSKVIRKVARHILETLNFEVSEAGDGREACGVAVNDAVDRVAESHGATPVQVRLAWVLARGPHVLAIPGTGREEHLAENLASADLALTADDLADLDSLSTPL